MDAPLKIDGSADMEAPIRKLDQSGAEAVVFLGKVGLGISVEHLQKSGSNAVCRNFPDSGSGGSLHGRNT